MIGFEFRKIWRNKKNIIFLILIFIANGIIFTLDIKNDTFYKGDYKRLYSEVKQVDHIEQWVQEEMDKIEFYQGYGFDIEGLSDDTTSRLQKYEDSYGEEWVQQRIQESQKMQILDYEFFSHKIATIKRIHQEIESANSYSEWKDGIIQRSQEQGKISIFQSNDATVKINKKIYEKYKNLDITSVTAQPSFGMEKVLTYTPLDILVLMVIVFFMIHTIYKEKESGYLSFTQSTLLGKRKQFIVKTVVLCISTIIIASFLFMENYIIACYAYGGAILSAPIQSLSFLNSTPYAFSILQFLVVYVLLMSCCFCVFVLIAVTLAYMSHSFVTVVIALSMVYGVSYFLYSEFSAVSQMPILHTLNLYNLLHPIYILGDYNFFVLGNWSISHSYTILLIPILLTITGCLGYRYFQKPFTFHLKMQLHLPTLFPIRATSLPCQELKKLMIKEKGIFAILIVLGISSYLIIQQKDCTTVHDIYFNHFVDTIGNHVNTESDQKLVAQEKLYEEYQRQATEAVSMTQKNEAIKKLESQNIFEMYKQAYENRKQSDVHREILKDDYYRMFYTFSDVTKVSYGLIMVTLLLLMVQSYHREKQYGMLLLQNSSISRSKVTKWKTIYIAGTMCLLSLFMFTLQVVKIVTLYPKTSLFTKVNAIESFYNSGFNIPLWCYLILIMLSQMILIISLIVILEKVLKKWNHHSFVLLVGFLILIVPILLPESFQSLGLTFMYHLYYPHEILAKGNMLYFLFIFVLLVGICVHFYVSHISHSNKRNLK